MSFISCCAVTNSTSQGFVLRQNFYKLWPYKRRDGAMKVDKSKRLVLLPTPLPFQMHLLLQRNRGVVLRQGPLRARRLDVEAHVHLNQHVRVLPLAGRPDDLLDRHLFRDGEGVAVGEEPAARDDDRRHDTQQVADAAQEPTDETQQPANEPFAFLVGEDVLGLEDAVNALVELREAVVRRLDHGVGIAGWVVDVEVDVARLLAVCGPPAVADAELELVEAEGHYGAVRGYGDGHRAAGAACALGGDRVDGYLGYVFLSGWSLRQEGQRKT